MSALVSVIVAARDEARFIGEALDSVWSQSYRPIELIVADDGSTDETAAIAAASDATVLSGPFGGTGAARNAALARAGGAFWAPFDADDLMPPDRLAVQVAALEADPELGFVTGLTEALPATGETRPPHWDAGWDTGPRPGHPGTMLARRQMLTRVGLYNESWRIAEDVDWLVRANEAAVRFRVLDHVCLLYRIHSANKTRDDHANHQDLIAIFRASLARRRAQGGEASGPDAD
jgi:glycosyltransferase involved in cell wall biosynthesis